MSALSFFPLAVLISRAQAAPTLAKLATKYKAIQRIAADEDEPEDDEELLCAQCNGSGEGMYDGSRCGSCRGSGVESSMTPEDIEDAKADRYNDERMERLEDWA